MPGSFAAQIHGRKGSPPTRKTIPLFSTKKKASPLSQEALFFPLRKRANSVAAGAELSPELTTLRGARTLPGDSCQGSKGRENSLVWAGLNDSGRDGKGGNG